VRDRGQNTCYQDSLDFGIISINRRVRLINLVLILAHSEYINAFAYPIIRLRAFNQIP